MELSGKLMKGSAGRRIQPAPGKARSQEAAWFAVLPVFLGTSSIKRL